MVRTIYRGCVRFIFPDKRMDADSMNYDKRKMKLQYRIQQSYLSLSLDGLLTSICLQSKPNQLFLVHVCDTHNGLCSEVHRNGRSIQRLISEVPVVYIIICNVLIFLTWILSNNVACLDCFLLVFL